VTPTLLVLRDWERCARGHIIIGLMCKRAASTGYCQFGVTVSDVVFQKQQFRSALLCSACLCRACHSPYSSCGHSQSFAAVPLRAPPSMSKLRSPPPTRHVTDRKVARRRLKLHAFGTSPCLPFTRSFTARITKIDYLLARTTAAAPH
jgi:hypothetical protein